MLEETLGLRLLDRRPRRVEPTWAGVALIDYAERIFALRDEMVEVVANTAALHGTLRLGMPETIVHTWLGWLVECLAADFPAVTLDVEVDSTPNLREALIAGRLDLVFLHAPAPDDKLTTLPLCSFPLSWFASPRLGLPPEPLRRGEAVRADPALEPQHRVDPAGADRRHQARTRRGIDP